MPVGWGVRLCPALGNQGWRPAFIMRTTVNEYKMWNDALARKFFNKDMAHRDVYLYVNKDLISEIRQTLPESPPFKSSVAGYPQNSNFNGERICERAYREFRRWRRKTLEFPPYIGYLCFFVLASSAEGEFASHAYYPRLWKRLGYEGRRGQVPRFDSMWELWDDLENWARVDKRDELGIFESRSIGGYIHVGYPLSQAILVETERQALPRVFYNAGLFPSSSHPAGEIAKALRSATPGQQLRPKTIQVAENPNDELYGPLIDAATNELEAWDGTIPELDPSRSQPAETFGGLRVCMEIDRVAGIVESSIRCKLKEFPEAGLTLTGLKPDEGLQAKEDVNGWSLPVKRSISGESGKILDAALLDWRNDVTMYSIAPKYQLRLKGYPVRVFTSGRPEGIHGLVDTPTLPQGQDFYLCYPEAAWPRLQRWATTQCRNFQDLDIARGIPKSWRLASVEEAISDEAVRDEFPTLSFPSELRLRLVGGIRTGKGNTFFDFAPPSIQLTGGKPGTEMCCNGELLSSPATGDVFTLPDNLPNGSRITIEARSGQSQKRQSLFLTGDFSLPTGEPEALVDSFGATAGPASDKTSVAGAYISGQSLEFVMSAAEVFQDLEYEIGRLKGFLVGQLPGQIVDWPAGPFPNDWTPTWAIKKRGPKKWEAVFVGEMLGATLPGTPDSLTRRNMKDWKKVIWRWRKRVLPPVHASERARWRQIQAVARDV